MLLSEGSPLNIHVIFLSAFLRLPHYRSLDYPLVMTILDAVSQGYAVLEIYSLILEMPSQRTCVTSCHFRHNRFSIWNPLKTKNRAWKVQRFLNSPNLSSFRAVSGLHPPEHR